MGKIRDIIRASMPDHLLNAFRRWKKQRRNLRLEKMRETGNVVTKEQLINDLAAIGLCAGDAVLVHCAMSSLGPLEEGPKTLVDALVEVIGENGHLLMPTSPNPAMQLDYIRNLDTFDLVNSPSKMGAVTEYFRKLPEVKRSFSPTEPVAAWGKDANWFVEGHYKKETPYDEYSPFARLAQREGKILYIGVSLINSGTSLHMLEDAVDNFPLPVYFPELFSVRVKDDRGVIHQWEVKVHNPEVSKLRRCDDLLPIFEKNGTAFHAKIANAKVWVFDAKKMMETMLDEYREFGVTMYDAKGRPKTPIFRGT